MHVAVHGVMRPSVGGTLLMGTGQASPVQGCQPLYRALLKLQLFICISVKASWDSSKEPSFPAEISSTTPPVTRSSSCTRVCVWHWNYKYSLLEQASVGHLAIP